MFPADANRVNIRCREWEGGQTRFGGLGEQEGNLSCCWFCASEIAMSEKEPQLSIIIPTLNEAEGIGRLLVYLHGILPLDSYEVIISDGGSTDQTVQIAARFEEVKAVQAPRGRSRQLNAGAHHAKGEWFYFLHADTLPPQDFHHHWQAVMKEGLDSAGFSLCFGDEHPMLRFCSWCSRIDWNCFRYGDQSLLLRRSVFSASGGYDEALEIMEGNDMVRRLKRSSRFRLLPAEVQTSARKYRFYGPFYLQAMYTLIYLLSRLGLGATRVARLYRWLLPPMEQQPGVTSARFGHKL